MRIFQFSISSSIRQYCDYSPNLTKIYLLHSTLKERTRKSKIISNQTSRVYSNPTNQLFNWHIVYRTNNNIKFQLHEALSIGEIGALLLLITRMENFQVMRGSIYGQIAFQSEYVKIRKVSHSFR